MSDAAGSPVVDERDERRFVVREGGAVAELVYRQHGDRFVLVHTGVPEALEGRGIGARLVQAAVDRAVAEGLTIVPECSFAAAWLERHPDVAASASIDWKAA